MSLVILATNWSTATSVCDWIGVTCGSRHQRVTTLNLFAMNLSGILPPHVGNLSFLAMLRLKNNSFHGSLPIELANLRRLKYLNLANNNFNVEIPSSLCSLSKLEVLSLYGNNLQGQIPVAIVNLSRLRWLFLVDNQLSGSIPSSIFSISSLTEVLVSFNRLTGSMPSIQLNISSLERIDLTSNNLTGHIPLNMFDYLPKLKGLYLSQNQFSGRIPMGLFKCQELEELSSSWNYLEGNIPGEIGNLTMLGGLQVMGLKPGEVHNKYLFHNTPPRLNPVAIAVIWMSFGILLMETITRKKPTNEIFNGEMNQKYWVKRSLQSALIEVVDTNLLNDGERQYSTATRDCALSILQLALECSEEVPEERTDMKEVAAKLKKIKAKFLKDTNWNRRAS
ncbi:hypothetical protein PTKIN_Ptkin14bG0168100 [Pterospermum kingtungense]